MGWFQNLSLATVLTFFKIFFRGSIDQNIAHKKVYRWLWPVNCPVARPFRVKSAFWHQISISLIYLYTTVYKYINQTMSLSKKNQVWYFSYNSMDSLISRDTLSFLMHPQSTWISKCKSAAKFSGKIISTPKKIMVRSDLTTCQGV